MMRFSMLLILLAVLLVAGGATYLHAASGAAHGQPAFLRPWAVLSRVFQGTAPAAPVARTPMQRFTALSKGLWAGFAGAKPAPRQQDRTVTEVQQAVKTLDRQARQLKTQLDRSPVVTRGVQQYDHVVNHALPEQLDHLRKTSHLVQEAGKTGARIGEVVSRSYGDVKKISGEFSTAVQEAPKGKGAER